MQQMTLTMAVRKFLMLDGEGLGEVKKNMAALTPQDRLDLTRDFAAIGIEIVTVEAK